MADICNICKTPLVNGTGYTLRAKSGSFDVTVENIPVKVCPKGHEGRYWFDRKFGKAFTSAMNRAGITAAGKRTITLKFRHACPSCKTELGRERTVRTFAFEFDTENKKGQMMKVTLSAPALYCGRCAKYCMPCDRGEFDAYYHELYTLLKGAIKKEFIL